MLLTRNKSSGIFRQNYITWKQVNNNIIEQLTLLQWFHFKQKMEKLNPYIPDNF